MIELVGWLSGFFLAICGAPQALKCWQQKHAHGISYFYLILWFLGELLGIIFVLGVPIGIGTKLPLLANYIANVIFTSIILRYRLWPIEQSSVGQQNEQ